MIRDGEEYAYEGQDPLWMRGLKATGVTWTQWQIMRFMAKHDMPLQPTSIGDGMRQQMQFGRYTAGSAWACPKLKLLVKRGLVAANEKRHYYLTDDGKEALRKIEGG